MTDDTKVRPGGKRYGSSGGLLAAGGMLGAFAASSCCILPLVLFSLGIGGAWVGNLAAFARYQPVIVTGTTGLLAAGFYLAYRKPRRDCQTEEACATRRSNRLVRACLWVATVVTAAALSFPLIAPALLGG